MILEFFRRLFRTDYHTHYYNHGFMDWGRTDSHHMSNGHLSTIFNDGTRPHDRLSDDEKVRLREYQTRSKK